VEVPDPVPGQILVRNTWMSIDAAMRIRMSEGGSYLPPYEVGSPLDGGAVGEVVESRAAGFAPGDAVWHMVGWRDYALLPIDDTTFPAAYAPTTVAVDETTLPQAYLGPLSLVGLTAYAGLLDVAQLHAGDVVWVSGAAGSVGGLAVQIAKLRGHTVIGSAGSPEKVAYVLDELGADAAFNYRDGDVVELVRDAAPDGIDVYFDNVGGDHLEAALEALRPGGRVALCGAISIYNETGEATPGPRNLFHAVSKGLNLRGFLAGEFVGRLEEFRTVMRGWLAEGRVHYPESIFEGLEQGPAALMALLRGDNVGKVLVRIA
jgi:NADPH-dependent curcumin reductase CurA